MTVVEARWTRRFASVPLHAAAVAVLCLFLGAPAALAAGPVIGQPAPAFSGTDSNGHKESLAAYRGKIVVLEWTNNECPFVGNQYRSGNMQALQQDATGQGVIWLSVISSAPGEQGYVTASEANRLTRERGAHPTAVILDPDGTIGRAYHAKTTPHMFVIDAEGRLTYMGAIDDRPASSGDPKTAHNYVREALAATEAGRPVPVAATQPYGCSVKYGS